MNYSSAIKALRSANKIVVVQAENPDADSLASSLALEDLLSEQQKQVELYCLVEIPKYLRYLDGWDRVLNKLGTEYDLAIIVDASRSTLLDRTLMEPEAKALVKNPVILIDHHKSEVDMPFSTINVVNSSAVSTGQIIADFAEAAKWNIGKRAANMIAVSILADSLGLSSPSVNAKAVYTLARMVELGANLNHMDELRRMFNKKSLEIFRYKGKLFDRVELKLEGKLAMVVIPWDEIAEYSDQYNPSMLIIDEMRLIEGVEIAAAFKTYPDGKVTAKLRSNPGADFMNNLAEHFGGGGHPNTAGFKVYDMPFDVLLNEFLSQLETYFSNRKKP